MLTAVLAAAVGAVVATLGDDDGGAVRDDEAACRSAEVAETVLPSVVTVMVGSADGSRGNGSGELIAEGGYLLTNEHVVTAAVDGPARLSVRYSDGTVSPAELVGVDQVTDLAVLRALDGAEGRPLLPYGEASELRVGQPVVALGAPLGLSDTVTAGIVSALGRYIPVPSEDRRTAHLLDSIQTDAAINPGNSGGPLVDCAGHLMGVNTVIATVPNSEGITGGGSVGLGFAVPATIAEPVAEDLIADGRVSHPVLGFAAHPVSEAGSSDPVGLLVTDVQADGPAARAGLRAGDVVLTIDGARARSADQLVLAALSREAGDTVALQVQRDGGTRDLEITLGSPR